MGTDEPGVDEQEREVVREWLHGAHVDIRVVRRQVAALLRIVEGYEDMDEDHPLEGAERPAEALEGPQPIQWTGDNEQAVRDWLGDRYEKTRGGLDANDPKVVWFHPGSAGGYLAWARPGDWLIRSGGDRIATVADEDYRRPR